MGLAAARWELLHLTVATGSQERRGSGCSRARSASYLTGQVAGRTFGGGDFVPESSRWLGASPPGRRSARSGSSGVADLVDRCRALASRFADGLDALPGVEVVNDVVLNQVLVRVGRDGRPRRRARPAGGHVLARRDDVARRASASHLGLELVDDRGRRRPLRRGRRVPRAAVLQTA